MWWLEYVSIAIAPALVWFASVVFRMIVSGRIPPTVGTDWLMLLISLDVALLFETETFKLIVQSSEVANSMGAYFGVAMGLTVILWMIAAGKIEPRIEAAGLDLAGKSVSSDFRVWFKSALPWLGWFLVGWLLVLATTAFHLYPFLSVAR